MPKTRPIVVDLTCDTPPNNKQIPKRVINLCLSDSPSKAPAALPELPDDIDILQVLNAKRLKSLDNREQEDIFSLASTQTDDDESPELPEIADLESYDPIHWPVERPGCILYFKFIFLRFIRKTINRSISMDSYMSISSKMSTSFASESQKTKAERKRQLAKDKQREKEAEVTFTCHK